MPTGCDGHVSAEPCYELAKLTDRCIEMFHMHQGGCHLLQKQEALARVFKRYSYLIFVSDILDVNKKPGAAGVERSHKKTLQVRRKKKKLIAFPDYKHQAKLCLNTWCGVSMGATFSSRVYLTFFVLVFPFILLSLLALEG